MPGGLTYLIVDGHSVIFAWPRLRQLHRRQPAVARQELIDCLQRLHDTADWRVTLVFDGRAGSRPVRHRGDIVVAYAKARETADSVIEKLVAASGRENKILVVTADAAERRTVEALGAESVSPEWLKHELAARALDFEHTLGQINKRARW